MHRACVIKPLCFLGCTAGTCVVVNMGAIRRMFTIREGLGMRIEIGIGKVTAYVDSPRRVKPRVVKLDPLSIIERNDLGQIIALTVVYLAGRSPKTQLTFLNAVLSRFGEFTVWYHNLIENDSERFCIPRDFASGLHFINQFGLWFVSNPRSTATLKTRCKLWRKNIRRYLLRMQAEGIIHRDIDIPLMDLPEEKVTGGKPGSSRVLGGSIQAKDEKFDQATDRTLAGPIFWKSDADYLDNIERTLRSRNSLLSSVLDDYWLRLVKDYRAGALMRVNEAEWKRRVESGVWSYTHIYDRGDGWCGTNEINLKLGSPMNPEGHIWALQIMRNAISRSDDIYCISTSVICQHPALNARFITESSQTPLQGLNEWCSLDKAQLALLKPYQLYARFLGVLTVTDMAVAVAILLQEHPNFTPEALASAELSISEGEYYFSIGGDDDEVSQIFVVEKKRAREKKYAILTHRARRVITHLVRCTAPVRELLKRAGSKLHKFLFLGLTRSGKAGPHLGHPPNIFALNLHRKSGVTLSTLYPALEAGGLMKGNLDFKRIRCTQGVLEWFDKGSIRNVQRKLGNSYRVVISHYIPEVVLHAWSERIVRIFQNSLLLIAACKEDYLLEVSDCSSLYELNELIANALRFFPKGRSPLSNLLHTAFASDSNGSKGSSEVGDILHLRLSDQSIALLIAHQQWATTNLSDRARSAEPEGTGLSANTLIHLTRMLQAIVTSDDVGNQLKDVIDLRRLKESFRRAECLVPELLQKLSSLRCENLWEA